mmetsp:Transcript_22811/g.77166  ORF Transcript_22811/g.77166 Transcript_22811/m.77166 type:complete len:290 (-) Transcript_22811:671-1540(-)
MFAGLRPEPRGPDARSRACAPGDADGYTEERRGAAAGVGALRHGAGHGHGLGRRRAALGQAPTRASPGAGRRARRGGLPDGRQLGAPLREPGRPPQKRRKGRPNAFPPQRRGAAPGRHLPQPRPRPHDPPRRRTGRTRRLLQGRSRRRRRRRRPVARRRPPTRRPRGARFRLRPTGERVVPRPRACLGVPAADAGHHGADGPPAAGERGYAAAAVRGGGARASRGFAVRICGHSAVLRRPRRRRRPASRIHAERGPRQSALGGALRRPTRARRRRARVGPGRRRLCANA